MTLKNLPFFFLIQDLATEVILTLGQAFEVAYQIALRELSPSTPLRENRTKSLVM